MEPQTGVKTWQWVVTAIVIIALIIIGIIVFGGKKSGTTEEPTPTVTTTPSQVGVNRITMNDQYPGNVVYVSLVQVTSPSWVVIQKDNSGVPGAIIGSLHVDAGINPNKTVNLTQSTVEGGTYYAVIYTDDGTGTFSATTDQPLKDASGNVIMQVFHASTSVGAGLKG